MSRPQKSLPPSFHLVFVVTLAMLVWAYWPEWGVLWETWKSDPDYNHGFLVIPISAWLLWQRRAGLASIEISPSWWGIGLVVVAGLLRWTGAEFFIAQIETWSIPVWVAGVVLLFGGWSLLRWSFGPIAFLWFMTPLPDSMIGFVSLPLQKCSAMLSTWTLHLFAQPAVRFGTTISLGEQVLEVERACSGLRICYGIMALAVAYVVLMRPRPLRAIILLALALPVAILANSARVTATGLLFLIVSGEEAHRYAHDFSGLLMMPFAVCLFWLAHTAMEKVIGAFEKSSKTGNMLVLKSGLAILVLATGLLLWQRRQSDAAVNTLLRIGELHDANGKRFQDEGKPREAAQEWIEAIGVLDRYCHSRPDDAQAARRLAEASERLASSKRWRIRASRYYERAWSLQPDSIEMGLKQARLALAGEDFRLALAAVEKLLQETDSGSPEYLEAFKIKIESQLRDAERSNSETTWEQVVECLQQGIAGDLEAVSCAYRLALLYRQHPVASIDEAQREVAAEQVLTDLLAKHTDDPMAWFARYAFHQTFPAPDVARGTNDNIDADSSVGEDLEPEAVTNPAEEKKAMAGLSTPNPDDDLDRAIELASLKITSDTHVLWLTAANRELARKDFTKARQYFRNAVQAVPTHFQAYLQLARIESGFEIDGNPVKQAEPKQCEAAITVLKEGLSYKELSDDVALQVELIRQQLKSMDEAHVAEANQEILQLKNRFKKMPHEIGVPLQLELAVLESQAFADAGNPEKASRLLDSVLTSQAVVAMKVGSGLLSSSWLSLGSYYEQQGLSQKASECFLRATELEPTSIPTTLFQAFNAERERNTSAAADLFEDAAARLGNRPELWLALARNELGKQLARGTADQNFSRLNSALGKATAFGAPEVETAVIYAEIAAAKKDIKQAIAILEEVASRYPASSDVWRMLALRRRASGDSAGARDALTKYQATVRNALEAVLLESHLLILDQEFDKAQQVLTGAMQAAADVEGQRRLQEQLIRIELLNARPEAAEQRLQQFAEQHPDDIKAKVLLANLYFGQRRFDLMEQAEQKLRELEGDHGTSWQSLRAQRLIQLAGQSQITKEREGLLTEAKSLINSLTSLSANTPETRTLQGQLALQEGRSADAARYFEAAWTQGDRTVRLATELIFALQASGEAQKAEYYLAQMQNLLPASPQLFDMALANRSAVSFSDLNKSTEIVQSWVQSIADADSYLRLARTLQLKKVQSEPQRTQWLRETESAYRKAIELDPKSSQAWSEFLHFLVTRTKDQDRKISELNTFFRNSEIPEIERYFVTSLLLAELNFPPQATRYWTSTIELAGQATDVRVQNRALLLAAHYFAGRDSSRAISLARQAVALKLGDATGLRLLTALLSDTNSVTSLKEASTLLDSLREIGELSANQLAMDSDKRIEASILYRRAVLLPSEFNATEDLRSAARLLQGLKPPTEADAVQLARIVAAQGDKQAALLALGEQARRIGASPPSIRAFVEYWQDNFAGTETMQDRVEQALQSLEKPSGSPITALDLRLRPAGLMNDEIKEIANQFVTNVVAKAPTTQLQDELLQQTFALLARKNLSAVSLQLLTDDSPPLTNAQKLKALVLITIQTPSSPEFELSVTRSLESQLPTAKNAELDRAAADYYFMRANWDSSEQCYRRCLEQDPNDVGAANNLALVVTEMRRDFEEADRLIQQSLTSFRMSNPSAASPPFLLDTQSQLLLAAGKNQQAFEILTQLAQSVTADASVFLHLAECYHKMDKAEESQHAFAVAQQLGISTSLLPPMDKRMYDSLAAAQKMGLGK